MQFQQHIYNDKSDLKAILALIGKRPKERRNEYPAPADLQELTAVAEIRRTINLWRNAAGTLAGYALFQGMPSFAGMSLEYLPEYNDTAIGDEMIDWVEVTYRQQYTGQEDELWTLIHNRDALRVGLLERHGFVRSEDFAVHMSRLLNEPIAEAQLPAGYAIRPLGGEAEAPAWVALSQAAFGTQNMTLEYKLAMMRVPDYDPELDLVAVAPDNSLAGFAVCWSNHLENELNGEKTGYTDPVGTHPGHQCRGLARALILRGLHLLRQRGLNIARLGTSGDNTAMLHTAQSVGFHEKGRSEWYVKKMR